MMKRTTFFLVLLIILVDLFPFALFLSGVYSMTTVTNTIASNISFVCLIAGLLVSIPMVILGIVLRKYALAYISLF